MAQTRVQIAMPQQVRIRRDGRGRIVSIDFADGRRTETEYNDAVPAYDAPGFKTLAYRFKTIRLTRPGGKPRELVVRDKGWTFVLKRTVRLVPRLMFATFRQPESGWGDLINDIKERYDEWSGRAETYEGVWDTATGPPKDAEDAIRDLEDSEHYHDGIEAALDGDTSDRLDWIIDHHERQAETVKAVTVVIGTLPTTSEAEEPYYGPDIAVPGSTGMQRLGVSPRSSR
jgi:YD repeat-containing protein